MLTRDDIVAGFQELGRLAQEAGVFVDLAVYGGSAIAIAWQFRDTTRDVDVVIQGDAGFVRAAARQIAQSRQWPEDWLNDAVKGFVSDHGDHKVYADYVNPEGSGGVRVFVPTTEYLLAMKCLAMRIGDAEGHDVEDIRHLITDLGLTTPQEVLDIVTRYYPASRITPKVFYGIQEILQENGSVDPR